MATILTKKKDTSGAPSAGDLTNDTGGAELAVNTADKRLYTKDSGGNVVEVGTNPSTINIDAGSIDGTPIGANSASTGSFTTLNTSGAVVFNDAGADVDFRVEGDTEANLLFVDAGNNSIGMGTSSPISNRRLTIKNTTTGTTASALYIEGTFSGNNDTTGIDFGGSSGNPGSAIRNILTTDTTGASALAMYTSSDGSTLTERMRITSSGNVGIGTSSPSNALQIARSSGPCSVLASSSLSNTQTAVFVADANGRSAELGVIKHPGITNNATFIALQEEDGANSYNWTDNSGNFRISSDFNNIGTTGGTVVGTQTSDERLKNILGPVSYGLNEILAIGPIAFTMKDDPSVQKIGFSAQQVQPIVPEAVYDTKECIDGYDVDPENKFLQTPKSDRTKLAMEYTQLIPVLVNAVKDLKAELDEAKARIAALENA